MRCELSAQGCSCALQLCPQLQFWSSHGKQEHAVPDKLEEWDLLKPHRLWYCKLCNGTVPFFVPAPWGSRTNFQNKFVEKIADAVRT